MKLQIFWKYCERPTGHPQGRWCDPVAIKHKYMDLSQHYHQCHLYLGIDNNTISRHEQQSRLSALAPRTWLI
ncbi:unnamed protein product [Nesidiocoris tenuis]|uniref:Uncharacterized protein n=1 Tax=Nesidiocoris tenuis TaxID=355587 RepID=A0A6H5GNY3_9HEMI|nr:unnamed protein product [Nesidiocoris tenuis]